MKKQYTEAVQELFYKLEEVDGIRNEIRENDKKLFEEIEEIEIQVFNNVDSHNHALDLEDIFNYVFEYNRTLDIERR